MRVQNSKMMRKTCCFQTPVLRDYSVPAVVNLLLGTCDEGKLAQSFHMIDTQCLGALDQLRRSLTMKLELTLMEVATGLVVPAH
jgi:hypothetical protein